MRTMIFALLAMVPGQALAGTPLWQNVEEGMTVLQVQALYPNAVAHRNRLDIRDYRPLPNCPSTVRVLFENGAVAAVQVRGVSSIAGICSSEIETALTARYGDPVQQSFTDRTLFTAGSYDHIWIHEGVVMRYRRRDGGGPSWIMEYVSADRLERERQRQARIGL